MFFWLKKILTVPFLPLYFALLAGTLGCLLQFSAKRTRIGHRLACLAVGVLALFSNKAVGDWLLRPLESRYAPLPEIRSVTDVPAALSACRAVVVLGGGHADAPALSRVNQLSTSSLSRVAEAVRLLRWLPEAKLVTSGHHTDEISHARVLAEAAESLGVPAARIERMDEPRDTDDEISELKARYGDAPVAIVTSAWHMPRAMELSRNYRLHAVPCPADYMSKPEPRANAAAFRWELEALERSTKAIHEDLGLVWLKLRGAIGK